MQPIYLHRCAKSNVQFARLHTPKGVFGPLTVASAALTRSELSL